MSKLLTNKIFFFAIIFHLLVLISSSSKDGTCDARDDPKYQKNTLFNEIIYSKNFLKQKVPNKDESNYIDLRINPKILDYVIKNGVINYPHKIFTKKEQGNFLYFMHLAYEKKLPIYFTIDQIIYPYIETTQGLKDNIFEFAFYPVYKLFLNNIINYGNQMKIKKNLILFYSIAEKFLEEDDVKMTNIKLNNENFDNNLDLYIKISQIIVNQLISKNETDRTFNFTLLGHKRILDKFKFIEIDKEIKEGNIIAKISNSLKFFQEFYFDASKELYNIYLIGKVIVDSDQEDLYYKIKRFYKYFFNEEENNMNPVEIYHFINKNYKKQKGNETFINNLYSKIKNKITKNKTYNFLNYIDFISKEQEMEYNSEINKEIKVFSYSSNIEDWVKNKMINFKTKRVVPSIVELIDIVHNGKIGRNTLIDRFNTKKTKNEILSFRDGINMTNELINAKKIIEKSLEEEKDKWLNSYENSFNYILNLIGKSANDYALNSLIKSFNTILGSYIHFKKDTLLIHQNIKVNPSSEGRIPEIKFENNTLFYKEIKSITLKFKEEISNLFDYIENFELKQKLKNAVDYKVDNLITAYDNILDILNYHKSIKHKKNIVNKMFYYDSNNKTYKGWYVDLYRNLYSDINYDLDIFGYNYHITYPVEQIKCNGAIIYETMNFPEFGLTSLEEKKTKRKKIFLFSTYSGNEYTHNYNEKIDFEGLEDILFERKY